jgi:hypothetical protein
MYSGRSRLEKLVLLSLERNTYFDLIDNLRSLVIPDFAWKSQTFRISVSQLDKLPLKGTAHEIFRDYFLTWYNMFVGLEKKYVDGKFSF